MNLPTRLLNYSLIVMASALAHGPSASADDIVSFGTGGYASGLRTEDMMHMIDTNKDGMISKDEWLIFEEKTFAAMDKNKNGLLDKKEFMGEGNPNFAFATAAYARGLRTEEMFTKIDTDSDGTISRDEFIAFHKKIFNMMDKKKKGMVGLVDFIQPAG
jgi:EF-hand domain pair